MKSTAIKSSTITKKKRTCRHKAERRQNHASLSAMNPSNIEDYEKVHSRGKWQRRTAKQSTIRMSTAVEGNDPVFTLNAEFLSHDFLKSHVKGCAVRWDKRLAHKYPLRNSWRHTRRHKHASLTYPRLKQRWKSLPVPPYFNESAYRAFLVISFSRPEVG